MRTTVTLDPDVVRLLKDAMHTRDLTFKEALNDAVRRGCAPAAAEPRPAYVPMTYDMGLPLVDLTKAGALADELEDQELLAKLRAGR